MSEPNAEVKAGLEGIVRISVLSLLEGGWNVGVDRPIVATGGGLDVEAPAEKWELVVVAEPKLKHQLVTFL
jgi:hypothetical protein